jgi:hypothetical protein
MQLRRPKIGGYIFPEKKKTNPETGSLFWPAEEALRPQIDPLDT